VPLSGALDRVRDLGPVFRSGEAVAAGVSWRDLYALRDQGQIIELSRGLFQLAEAAGTGDVDFVAVSARVPNGTICLNSALVYWDLSDEIPPFVHLAVQEGAHRPTIDHPPVKVHVFRADTFEIGRIEVQHQPRERFWISDRERSIVDAFRLRHLLGDDMAHAAVRRYLEDRPKIVRLTQVARELRIWNPLARALRILQA
jgi:predicted transcriptional regulator of viral defense system